MTQVKSVSEQLWSQGINHFVILSSSGDVIESCGQFSSPQKQRVAAALLLQLPAVLQQNEAFQRVTMTFQNAVAKKRVLANTNQNANRNGFDLDVLCLMPNLGSLTSCFLQTCGMTRYALVDDTHTDYLLSGKNVIGRGSVELEGVSFVEIPSPNSSVSRVQANIEICPNGDAWICDCNSTNGTFLAINDGAGICLEQKHYYQLSDGCHVIFGDVERVFKRVTSESLRSSPCKRSSSGDVLSRPTTEVLKKSNSMEGGESVALTKTALQSKKRLSTSTTPYLADEDVPSTSNKASDSPPKGRKRAAEFAFASLAKKSRGEKTPPLIACLSGMDAEEREQAKKAIRPHGKVVDDIGKANVLVVRLPAVRTPKFIIAVGKGIPIVSVETFQSDSVTSEKLRDGIVSLRHEKATYSSDLLREAIYRECRKLLLSGRSFSLHSLPVKSRDVAKDVIVGCGGKIARTKAKNDTVTEVTEDNLNQLYDSILRGRGAVDR